jgi:hypothetical protein
LGNHRDLAAELESVADFAASTILDPADLGLGVFAGCDLAGSDQNGIDAAAATAGKTCTSA